jgi:hypothetical protein
MKLVAGQTLAETISGKDQQLEKSRNSESDLKFETPESAARLFRPLPAQFITRINVVFCTVILSPVTF